jgi:hypothetical protein
LSDIFTDPLFYLEDQVTYSFFIYSRNNRQMEEELHLLRDLYASSARKNLAEEHFYNYMTVQHGGVPPVVPPGMQNMSRLSDLNYNPNLGDVNNDQDVNEPRNMIVGYFYIPGIFFQS